jgi:DNA-binding NarL/FixJ family response regulator
MASLLAQLVSLLETEFDVAAAAENGKSALECLRRYAPDVVVLDLHMPVLNGIEVTLEARKLAPSPAIVICSVEGDPDIIEAAKKAGALGLARSRAGGGTQDHFRMATTRPQSNWSGILLLA